MKSILIIYILAASFVLFFASENAHVSSAQNTTDITNATESATPKAEKHEETPGEKTLYVFTSEVENVDEDKLGVAGDSFDVQTLVVNQGDKVNVNFYNVDDVQTEKHSFTIDDPYKVNIDLAFAEKGNATFTVDEPGVFTYYCAYHLPVMKGQLVVLPQ
jgi:nitrous oxide reductase